MLERANIASNSGFIEIEKFEFEYISNSRKMDCSSLSLNLKTSLLSFGLNTSSISSFIEFEFLKNTNHRTQISSNLKLK